MRTQITKTEMKQYNFDGETIVICALIAVMTAIGITAGMGFIFDIQVTEMGWLSIAGIITGLTGVIWGALVVFNMNGNR